ncbi:MAG: hypothetical protein MUE83_08895 [Tabrizicola sp.]|jgi:uncharacterized membrane protein|nr:hypothetical protein [Tabrizicola sp.]
MLMLHLASTLTPADLSRHAKEDDEGLPLIVVLAVVTVLASATGIFPVTNAEASAWPVG